MLLPHRASGYATAAGRCAPRCPRRIRAGYTSLASIVVMVIAITSAMLAINWAYLVMIQRRTQGMSDVLARSAVEELLDQGLLEDDPIVSTTVNQSDDVTDALAMVEQFRLKNNAVAAGAFRLSDDNVHVRFGYVANVTQPVAGGNFDTVPPSGGTPAGVLYNTLLVEVLREPGSNPAEILWRGFGTPQVADKVACASYATLDNRVVGFAPSASVNAPLVPLAIDISAWLASRAPGGTLDDFTPSPPGGPTAAPNGIVELDILLENPLAPMPVGTANAALIDFDGSLPLGFAAMPGQITDGVSAAQIAGGEAGPATPSSPLSVPGTQSNPANVAAIVAAFDAVAASGDPRRVFPFYDTFAGGQADLTGFIAANVLEAELQAGPRLRVRIEPAFIVHFTAVTDPALPDADANIYIHKLRLSR